jgi:hypothetical protein
MVTSRAEASMSKSNKSVLLFTPLDSRKPAQ